MSSAAARRQGLRRLACCKAVAFHASNQLNAPGNMLMGSTLVGERTGKSGDLPVAGASAEMQMSWLGFSSFCPPAARCSARQGV